MHQVIAEHVRLQPVELLILIATTTGNVQRALRTQSLPEALRGSKPLPPDLVVPISRRAIATVTGIPTETVRRHVDSMVKLASRCGGTTAACEPAASPDFPPAGPSNARRPAAIRRRSQDKEFTP